MLEFLNGLDTNLFLQINTGWSNSVFDAVMPWLRKPVFWVPLYVVILYVFIRKYKQWAWLFILFLLITVGVSDYVSASIIKPLVGRIRPCNNPDVIPLMILRIPCGAGKSFLSAHASNHFAIAVFISSLFAHRYKWIWVISLLWASIICLAQVYVGVHYPFDVLCGALLGSLIGFGGIFILNKVRCLISY